MNKQLHDVIIRAMSLIMLFVSSYHVMAMQPITAMLCNIEFIGKIIAWRDGTSKMSQIISLVASLFEGHRILLPLRNHGGTIHPSCAILKHAMSV